MGIVYRAVRESDGAEVALKLLRDDLAGDEVFVRRFEREGDVARGLRHRGLIAVIDSGEDEGRRYLASTYVHGPSLAERIAELGPLEPATAVRLAGRVGSGLDELHRRGLVHRDVKPSNIMLDERGEAALTDFGLAKGAAHTVLTKPGHVVGTMDYMAPEVISGEAARPASDVYALGCTLFECLTGTPPFGHRSYVGACLAHLREEPPEPRTLRPELPAELSWALLRGLAKKPAERPQTGSAYARLLRASFAGS
jgi:serine/threonine-protein kinase